MKKERRRKREKRRKREVEKEVRALVDTAWVRCIEYNRLRFVGQA